MQRSPLPLACAALIAACAAPALSAPEILYALRDGNGSPDGNRLMTVNPATAAVTASVQITLPGFGVALATGLAAHPTTHVLYALLRTEVIADGGRPTRLVTLNPATGVATNIGILPDSFNSLAFLPNGTLLSITDDQAQHPGAMYVVNPATATTFLYRALSQEDESEALAWDPAGFLAHANGSCGNQVFERIDIGTGVSTPLINPDSHSLGNSGAPVGDMAWNDNNSLLYAVRLFDIIWTIDPTNGAAVRLGSATNTGDHNIRGLEYSGPSTLYAIVQSPAIAGAQIYTLDPTTGVRLTTINVTVPNFSFNGLNTVDGLVRHPTTGTFYSLFYGQGVEGLKQYLATVSPATGAAAIVHSVSAAQSFRNIAFRPNGALLGITSQTPAAGLQPESLYSINTTTGAAAFVLAVGHGDEGEAIATTEFDNFLYHASGAACGQMHFDRIDVAATTVTSVHVPGHTFGYGAASAMGYSTQAAALFVADDNGELSTFDPFTAATVHRGSIMDPFLPSSNGEAVRGLAFVPGPSCAGDTNGDGVIDFIDLNIVLSAFGTSTGNPNFIAGADLDGDGDVDFIDLNIVLSYFGTAC